MKNIKILIIGGSGSIGIELVRSLISKDYYVIATGNKVKKKSFFKKIGKSCPKNCEYFSYDFSNIKNTKAFLKKINKLHKDIHLVINCSGAINRKNFETETDDQFQKIMNINFFSPRLIIKNLIRLMKKKKKRCNFKFFLTSFKVPSPQCWNII